MTLFNVKKSEDYALITHTHLKKRSDDSGLHTYRLSLVRYTLPLPSPVIALRSRHPASSPSPPLLSFCLVPGVRPWYTTTGPASDACFGQAF